MNKYTFERDWIKKSEGIDRIVIHATSKEEALERLNNADEMCITETEYRDYKTCDNWEES